MLFIESEWATDLELALLYSSLLFQYTEACRKILQQAGAHIEVDLLPGSKDLSDNFSNPQEYLGEAFEKPCNEEQAIFLRKSRNLFTSGEDNLVLRGVNLYGEKQWTLITDRFLSDRSINTISQRYSKLCVMLYKAHGINIDTEGNLDQPPKLDSVEDIDDKKVARIPRATPPAILNVHRWSLEEDLTLLRAVPLMGHMWAELGARLMPHRDRGHLRKRYQVLERRVKATMSRALKSGDPMAKLSLKIQEQRRSQKEPLVDVPKKGHQPRSNQKSQSTGLLEASTAGSFPAMSTASTASLFASSMKCGSSRAAFEQLANETNPEWSQMAGIEKIIESDVETEIVGALANRLTKSTSNAPEEPPKKDASSGASSIMASVLERANGDKKNTLSAVAKRKDSRILPRESRYAKQPTTSKEKESSKQCASSWADSGTQHSATSVAPSLSDNLGLCTAGEGNSMDGLSLGGFDSHQVLEYGQAGGRYVE